MDSPITRKGHPQASKKVGAIHKLQKRENPWLSGSRVSEVTDFWNLDSLNSVKSPVVPQNPWISESRVTESREIPSFFTNPSTLGISSVWTPWNPSFFHKFLDFRSLQCLNPVFSRIMGEKYKKGPSISFKNTKKLKKNLGEIYKKGPSISFN